MGPERGGRAGARGSSGEMGLEGVAGGDKKDCGEDGLFPAVKPPLDIG